MFLEGMIMLAVMYANVSVPVVPDPNYLQQIYPTTTNIPDQYLSAPIDQQQLTGATQQFDVGTIINLAVSAGLGYFGFKQKTTTDRRTYMAADTTVKLAANDQASDARSLKMAYALACVADVIGKHHRDDMETYETIDGVSLWTYIENLNTSYNQDFQARYVNKGPVETTGTQSKDKVVSTFNQVQQSITPSATAEIPNTLKVSGSARVEVNKGTNTASGTVSQAG